MLHSIKYISPLTPSWTSTLQHFNTSTLQHFNTSTLQHFKMKSSQVIEYEEALRKNAWEGERKLADMIRSYTMFKDSIWTTDLIN